MASRARAQNGKTQNRSDRGALLDSADSASDSESSGPDDAGEYADEDAVAAAEAAAAAAQRGIGLRVQRRGAAQRAHAQTSAASTQAKTARDAAAQREKTRPQTRSYTPSARMLESEEHGRARGTRNDTSALLYHNARPSCANICIMISLVSVLLGLGLAVHFVIVRYEMQRVHERIDSAWPLTPAARYSIGNIGNGSATDSPPEIWVNGPAYTIALEFAGPRAGANASLDNEDNIVFSVALPDDRAGSAFLREQMSVFACRCVCCRTANATATATASSEDTAATTDDVETLASLCTRRDCRLDSLLYETSTARLEANLWLRMSPKSDSGSETWNRCLANCIVAPLGKCETNGSQSRVPPSAGDTVASEKGAGLARTTVAASRRLLGAMTSLLTQEGHARPVARHAEAESKK